MELSCGVIITCNKKVLLGHITNKSSWDIPKGLKEKKESNLDCAIRELMEETGLDFKSLKKNLIPLGQFNYTKEKNLYLFRYDLKVMPNLSKLKCNSFFEKDGVQYPELDRFAFVDYQYIHTKTNYKLAFILAKILNIPFTFEQRELIRRTICFVLRHKIEENSTGYLDFNMLYDKCIEYNPLLSICSLKDFLDIIMNDKEERFTVKEGLIKVNYGHSVSIIEDELEEIVPPSKLYHNTFDCFLNNIFELGLKPMTRKHVFLATTKDKALNYSKKTTNAKFRKEFNNPNPILLEIDAIAANNAGVKFYKTSKNIIRSDEIPSKFIKEYKAEDPINEVDFNKIVNLFSAN